MTKHDIGQTGLVITRTGLVPGGPPELRKPSPREAEPVERLIESLWADGHLTQREWADALRAVPRHLFVPERAWARLGGGSGHLIDRQIDPEDWLAAAYAGYPIVTQLNDGDLDAVTRQGWPSSALSAVWSVVEMLELLHPYDNDRVLEIGTGVGYTTGLLCHRLGPHNVTSIEIDTDLSARASANLNALGYAPNLITGDGANGWGEDAPYDRVFATCGITTVPFEWVAQTRPGGVIVTPWMPEWLGGHTLKLTVMPDGTAVGRLFGTTHYMMLRSQRSVRPDSSRLNGQCHQSETMLDPRRILWPSWGADVAIAGMLPHVSGTYEQRDDGSMVLRAWSADSEVSITYTPGRGSSTVRWRGRVNLWQQIQQAYFTWVALGEPDRDRFGLTLTRDGMTIWIDTPDHELSPVT